MVRSVAAAAAFALLVVRACAGFDFTPHDSFYEIEGIRIPILKFHDRGKIISYTPPAQWHPSGRGKTLALFPPKAVQAGAVFEAVSASSKPLQAVPENVGTFRMLAVGLLPPDASKVTVTAAAVSELQISGRPGVEVLLSYTSCAQQFTMTVLFIPHDEELLHLRFTAHTADFAALEKLFRRSLYSLQGL